MPSKLFNQAFFDAAAQLSSLTLRQAITDIMLRGDLDAAEEAVRWLDSRSPAQLQALGKEFWTTSRSIDVADGLEGSLVELRLGQSKSSAQTPYASPARLVSAMVWPRESEVFDEVYANERPLSQRQRALFELSYRVMEKAQAGIENPGSTSSRCLDGFVIESLGHVRDRDALGWMIQSLGQERLACLEGEVRQTWTDVGRPFAKDAPLAAFVAGVHANPAAIHALSVSDPAWNTQVAQALIRCEAETSTRGKSKPLHVWARALLREASHGASSDPTSLMSTFDRLVSSAPAEQALRLGCALISDLLQERGQRNAVAMHAADLVEHVWSTLPEDVGSRLAASAMESPSESNTRFRLGDRVKGWIVDLVDHAVQSLHAPSLQRLGPVIAGPMKLESRHWPDLSHDGMGLVSGLVHEDRVGLAHLKPQDLLDSLASLKKVGMDPLACRYNDSGGTLLHQLAKIAAKDEAALPMMLALVDFGFSTKEKDNRGWVPASYLKDGRKRWEDLLKSHRAALAARRAMEGLEGTISRMLAP